MNAPLPLGKRRSLARLAERARAGDPTARRQLASLLHLARSESWRATPASFAAHLSKGRYKRARHVDYLSETLASAAFEDDQRVVVSMPVRHGKSWLSSMWFVVWFLDRFPSKKVILCGHGAGFAQKWGRRVRNLIERHKDQLRVRLAPDSKAADSWETTEGGGMLTAGIGGPINGEGADLLVLDDYVKNAEEAYSQTFRDKLWEWWESTASTRLEPGCSCVIVATRWHEDDLIGRLLAEEDSDWRQVIFPAIAEENDVLGRKPGEALWPERWPLWRLLKRKKRSAWVWAALYQQRPSPAEGGFFKKHWFRYYQREGTLYRYRWRGALRAIRLHSMTRFVVVDPATSIKEKNDQTAIAAVGVTPDGAILLLEVMAARMEGPDIVPAIQGMLDRWEASTAWIEKVAFQLSLVQHARRAGLAVRELSADRDKLARALPATALLEDERVLFPATADWLEGFEAEVLSFPGGKHDDQVDALSYAVLVALEVAFGGADYYDLPDPEEDTDDRIHDRLDTYDEPAELSDFLRPPEDW